MEGRRATPEILEMLLVMPCELVLGGIAFGELGFSVTMAEPKKVAADADSSLIYRWRGLGWHRYDVWVLPAGMKPRRDATVFTTAAQAVPGRVDATQMSLEIWGTIDVDGRPDRLGLLQYL